MANSPTRVANSVFWSGIERLSVQGIQFVLTIILARMVSPSDYGLIALLTVFLVMAQVFIDSGFSMALIQKQNPILILLLVLQYICFYFLQRNT